jgi:hypothetical protein
VLSHVDQYADVMFFKLLLCTIHFIYNELVAHVLLSYYLIQGAICNAIYNADCCYVSLYIQLCDSVVAISSCRLSMYSELMAHMLLLLSLLAFAFAILFMRC